MLMWRIMLIFITSFFGYMNAMETKPAVVVDVNSLIEQNIAKKKDVLTSTLDCWTLTLWMELQWAFKTVITGEGSAQKAFFGFLDGIPLNEKYPVTLWKHHKLPAIMSAWTQGDLKTSDVFTLTEKHIAQPHYSEGTQKVLRAMVKTTFDLETLEQTSDVNETTLATVSQYHQQGHPTYLIGHCSPELHSLIRERGKEALAQFTGVLFSYQAKTDITPETIFDRSWWTSHLGLQPGNYTFIDSGTLPDQPTLEMALPNGPSAAIGSGRTVSPVRI